MNYSDPVIMRQIIISHYQNPKKKGFLSNNKHYRFRVNSSKCIDDITVEVILLDNIIKTSRFEGTACTVGIASTDIICMLIEGKTIEAAKIIIENFESLLHNREYSETILQEAVVFQNTYKQRNRIHCAKIGSDAIKSLL